MSEIPKGDPANGAKIFKQRCAQCHTTEKVSDMWHNDYFHGTMIIFMAIKKCLQTHKHQLNRVL